MKATYLCLLLFTSLLGSLRLEAGEPRHTGEFRAPTKRLSKDFGEVRFNTTMRTASQAFSMETQIPGYIFGAGRLGSRVDRPLKFLASLSVKLRGKVVEVPMKALQDLAGLQVPKTIRILRRDDVRVLQIEGPEGSEGYEVQFVFGGEKFLHRLIQFGPSPLSDKYPAPLKLSP